MPTLNKKTKELSDLTKYKKEFDNLLNLYIEENPKKEAQIIFNICSLKVNELNNILKSNKDSIVQAIKKHFEIDELLIKLMKLSSKFENHETTEILIDGIKRQRVGIVFIIANHAIEDRLKKYKIDEKIKVLQLTLKLIKKSQHDYLTISDKNLLLSPINYYFYVFLNISNKILKTKKYLDKKNKGFLLDNKKLETKSKIQKLDQQQELLSDLIYNFISFAQEADQDLTICLANISWEKYENITETMGETSWYRVSYLDGVLELMTTSERHEIIKLIIHDLITDYFRKKKIGCIAVGSATYRNKEQKRGKEADSAYKFSEKARYPEFAIEVNLSSGGIESLEIYKGFATKEVWMWDKENNLKLYVFEKDSYRETSKSFFLKGIEANIIKKYVLLIEDNKLQKYQIIEDFIEEIFSK